MKIVVCDDKKEISNQISAYAKEWAKEKDVAAEVFAYGSAEEFLPYWGEGEDYDVIFLDT